MLLFILFYIQSVSSFVLKMCTPFSLTFCFFFLTTFCSLSFSSLTYQSKLTYDLWYVWPFQLPGRYLEWVLGKTWSQNKKKRNSVLFSLIVVLYLLCHDTENVAYAYCSPAFRIQHVWKFGLPVSKSA